jgi:hypothetical protein
MVLPAGQLPWHALLAPLPPDARPTRKPIASPEILVSAEGSAIAGWTSVSLELGDPPRGLRHLLVTLDETGRPLSATDHVLFRLPRAGSGPETWDMRQESIGGRLEADGTFRGTCWLVTGPEPEGDASPNWDMRSRPPEDAEIARLKALVADILRRLEG